MAGVQAAFGALQEASKLGDNKAYDALEGDFQEVLQELATDKGLERFRIEYEKLYRALKKSHGKLAVLPSAAAAAQRLGAHSCDALHLTCQAANRRLSSKCIADNEKRLVKKCRELNTEIVGNAAKVQTALKLSEEDQQTIVALKKEIEKAWKMVDASHEKEAKAKEAITQLKAEIANLTRMAEAGSALSMGEEATLNELMRQRDDLTRERDGQVEQILGLRSDLMDAAEKLRRAESDKQQAEADIASLKQQIAEKKSEAEREGRRRERLDREVRDLKAQVEAKNMEVRTKQLDIAGAEEQVARLEGLLKEAKSATDKVQKEFNALSEKLLADSSSKQVELRSKEDELAALRVEMAKVVKVKDATMKKMKSLEEAKECVESERDALKATVASLSGTEQKKLDELAHERDILNKLRTQADSATQRQVDLVRMTENTKRTWSRRAEAQRSAKQLVQLEKEREKYSLEASEANACYMQDEISEMKRKFKIMGHQIEQLKEELGAKDLALVKEHFDHMKVGAHCGEACEPGMGVRGEGEGRPAHGAEQGTRQHFRGRERHRHAEGAAGEAEPVVAEADAERVRQKKELDLVLGERDILGTQLIRRNDELALLYEKVKIQQSTLSRGQLQYRDSLLCGMCLLKHRMPRANVAWLQAERDPCAEIKLADLKRELHVLRTGVANVDVLKREVASLGRQLLQERTKVRALGEELENPLNVHRWRKLEGSDPSTYEMIQKIQTLQKRLISKTEEAVEKDLLIQEKEKLYVELKGILARQPGPEVAEQLSIYQASLRDKTKQLKAMASELNMYQAQMVAMEDRPDAFVGIAAVDRGENDNHPVVGEFPVQRTRVALLAAGDVAALLAFAAVGRVNHGEPLLDGGTLTTALPFIVAVDPPQRKHTLGNSYRLCGAGWFASAALLGGFSKQAQGGNAGAAAAAAAKTWALGVPLGIVIRSISRGYVPAASFIYVALGATGVLMIGWRAALAAVTPEAEELTPAQAAAKRKDRSGGFLEGVQMIMSLTKRW
ncbi:hypothetical protein COO60DRAFT_1457868 [Scenedesmus sp. NREL 46B-D3]|nr:hypothetical protein COO60DRAFT_1457868 [Scenedesmus sp. NREL 46B-D3]